MITEEIEMLTANTYSDRVADMSDSPRKSHDSFTPRARLIDNHVVLKQRYAENEEVLEVMKGRVKWLDVRKNTVSQQLRMDRTNSMCFKQEVDAYTAEIKQILCELVTESGAEVPLDLKRVYQSLTESEALIVSKSEEIQKLKNRVSDLRSSCEDRKVEIKHKQMMLEHNKHITRLCHPAGVIFTGLHMELSNPPISVDKEGLLIRTRSPSPMRRFIASDVQSAEIKVRTTCVYHILRSFLVKRIRQSFNALQLYEPNKPSTVHATESKVAKQTRPCKRAITPVVFDMPFYVPSKVPGMLKGRILSR